MERFEGKVKLYTYRSARAIDFFMVLPRSACHDLEQRLAKEAGAEPDNHTTYRVTYNGTGNEEVTYIMFSDFNVYFGRSVIEKPW